MGGGARTIAGLGLTGIWAVAALASGIDRLSEYRPEVAARVPSPFRVNSARVMAGQALAARNLDARDLDEAKLEARRAVRRDPVDARSAGLLGTVLLTAGDPAGAERAFTVSAAMGWREPATQLYWMSVALDMGDIEVASQRLDALLRQSPQFAVRQQLLAAFEATPEGRTELARRLADSPIWGASYFIDGYMLPPAGLARRAQVAESLGARVQKCELVARMTFNLVTSGQIAAAHRVWQAHCQPGRKAGNVADGNFTKANFSRPLTAFDWTWPEDGSIGVSLVPASGRPGNALQVMSSASGTRDFASQLTLLAPGLYRATWRARTAAGTPAAAIRPSIACAPDTRHPLVGQLIEAKAGHFNADFEVPADCPAQQLVLAIAPGSDPVMLDEVAIARR